MHTKFDIYVFNSEIEIINMINQIMIWLQPSLVLMIPVSKPVFIHFISIISIKKTKPTFLIEKYILHLK
jgi:hypothetical protein